MLIIIGVFPVISNAVADRPTSYGLCSHGTFSFSSSYTHSFSCDEIGSLLTLEDTNHATTDLQCCPVSNTYKEAYVCIWNSNGTAKTKCKCNSVSATVDAEVNPIAFTPVKSQHDILCYESEGYMMHSYIYQ